MGLRERNATRTRQHIIDAATELFVRSGYDHTTMEDIAALAEISPSTLYRYFPAKEDLVVGALGDAHAIAEAVRARPAAESPEVAVGQAILALLEHVVGSSANQLHLGRLLENEPRPRARVLDWLKESFDALVEELAVRVGTTTDDVRITGCAWLAIHVFQCTHASEPDDVVSTARRVMREMAERGVLIPQLPPEGE